MKLLPINTTVYAVSKTYTSKLLPLDGSRVIPCKVKTYQNSEGSVITICKSSESKYEITDSSHVLFDTLSEAVNAISNQPVSVVKSTPKVVKKPLVKKVPTKKVVKKKT